MYVAIWLWFQKKNWVMPNKHPQQTWKCEELLETDCCHFVPPYFNPSYIYIYIYIYIDIYIYIYIYINIYYIFINIYIYIFNYIYI